MVMAITIEKVLADARLLVTRLKDHDNSADHLIAHTQTLNKRVEAMKQYEEDLNELNELARHKPRAQLVLGIAQENSQIRELQQENRELRSSLEEHQSALELIMSKYREQVCKLVMANRADKTKVEKEDYMDYQEKIDKICEMAAVMQRAVHIDDEHSSQDQQMIAQLKLENKTLREILQISSVNRTVDSETQTELAEGGEDGSIINDIGDFSDTASTCSSNLSIDVSPNASLIIQPKSPGTPNISTANKSGSTSPSAKTSSSKSSNTSNLFSRSGTIKKSPDAKALAALHKADSSGKVESKSPKSQKTETPTKSKTESPKSKTDTIKKAPQKVVNGAQSPPDKKSASSETKK